MMMRVNCAGFMVNGTSFSHDVGDATRMDHIVSTLLVLDLKICARLIWSIQFRIFLFCTY